MHYPFFGSLALYLKLVEDSSLNPATAATDGKDYYYHPEFVDSLTDPEVNFLTAHETLHPALGHLWRRGSRDPIIWNHAADYCINAMILESDPTGKDFKLIKGVLYDKKFEGMYSEEIYDILIKDEDYVKKAHAARANGEGDGTLDDHSQWGKGKGKPGDEEGEGEGGGNNPEDWNRRVIKSAQAAQSKKGRGTMPGALKRLIDSLVRPQKNWKQLLAEFVQQEINDYGWAPPNTHHLWRDIFLPDFTESTDMVKDLVFAIDTSGSIGSKEMRTFISEIVGCMEQFGGKVRGHLVYCDARVAAVYELEDTLHSVPAGGGGTAFEPVFEWVEENLEDCAGVVYLTDLMGSFPKEEPHYPTLWVSTEQRVEAPFGTTTYIDIV